MFWLALWLFLPMGLANMTPVLVKNQLEFLAVPISKKWLGENKTYRGFICGTLVGGIIGLYLEPWYLGFILGFGALFGDAVKSFVKRRFKIPPGQPWIPMDQIDYTIGALWLASWFIEIVWPIGLIVVALGLALHFLTNYLGYKLKIKKNKW